MDSCCFIELALQVVGKNDVGREIGDLAFGGADSIHLASAMELKCEEFLTWDKQPHANAAALNDLALSVRFSRDTRCLPDRYRQLLIGSQQSTASDAELPTRLDQGPNAEIVEE